MAAAYLIFYILTALAAIVYYRRRIGSNAWDFVTAGLLPLGAAGFLGWIFVKSLGEAPREQRWSLIGVVIAGLVLLVVARFVLRSGFFSLPRESEVRSAPPPLQAQLNRWIRYPMGRRAA